MIEFTEYVRDPHAHQILVNKIGGIYRINQSILKCTFVLASPSAGGIIQAIERVSLLWQNHDVQEANEQFNWAFNEVRNGTFILPDDGGGRRPRTQ